MIYYLLSKEDYVLSVRYNEDFKKEVVKAYRIGDKSISQLSADFNIVKSTIRDWTKKYKDECQYTTNKKESDSATEIRRLNQKIKEQEKEIDFLKKQRHSSQRKSISGIPIY